MKFFYSFIALTMTTSCFSEAYSSNAARALIVKTFVTRGGTIFTSEAERERKAQLEVATNLRASCDEVGGALHKDPVKLSGHFSSGGFGSILAAQLCRFEVGQYAPPRAFEMIEGKKVLLLTSAAYRGGTIFTPHDVRESRAQAEGNQRLKDACDKVEGQLAGQPSQVSFSQLRGGGFGAIFKFQACHF